VQIPVGKDAMKKRHCLASRGNPRAKWDHKESRLRACGELGVWGLDCLIDVFSAFGKRSSRLGAGSVGVGGGEFLLVNCL